MKKLISILLVTLMLVSMIPVAASAAKGETTYTMWGNNVLQAFIHENGYNESAPYEKKPTARYEGLIAALQHYSPDIVALQECDLGWHNIIDDFEGYATENGIKTFKDIGYVSVLDTTKWDVEGVRTPLYIKAGKFNVIDSGVVRYGGDPNYYEYPFVFCWAVLEDKASGDRFAVSSTHIVSGSNNDSAKAAQVRELVAFMKNIEKTQKVPLVMMGDYNVSPDPAHYPMAYSEFKLGDLLLTSREVAKEVVGNNYQTHNSLGKKPSETSEVSDGVIDHAMISPVGIAPIKYETMVEVFDSSKNLATYTYSDHVPQRLTFKVVGTDHKHTYANASQYNEINHELECSVCYLKGYAEHNFGEGYVPTEGSETMHERQCVDCGYGDKSEHVVPVGEKIDNDTHRGECELCGASGIGAHVYSWTNADASTCKGECSCGVTTTRSHVYEYTSNGNKKDDTHTGACACGNTADEAHKWDDGKVSKKVTYASDGKMTYTCTLCAQTREENIEKLSVPESAFELTEGGQKHLYAGEATDKAPKTDGKITDGEYNVVFNNISTKTDEENDLFFHDDPTKATDVSDIEIYSSYDAENLYFAVKVKDSSYDAYGDSASFFLGATDKINELNMIYMPRIMSGVPEVYPWGYEFNSSSRIPPQAEGLCSKYVKSYKTVDKDGVVVYEIAIKRDTINVSDLDKIFFACRVTSGGNETMYFGFDTTGLEGVHDQYNTSYQKVDMYPHVMLLSGAPETEPVETEPQATEPVETEPAETTPIDTAPIESAPAESEPKAEGGCGAAISAIGVMLVAMIGACITFISKKR